LTAGSQNDDDIALRLVGYEAQASHGYALPLFGQNPLANTFYVAGCRPDGDHLGVISRFDIYEPTARESLPIERFELVRVGDPWLDVFLWNGDVLVGDAAELWQKLRPLRPELERLAPLSLLDAAMLSDPAARDVLAPLAMKYMSHRFGDERAGNWRERTLRRQFAVQIGRVARLHRTSWDIETDFAMDMLEARLRLPNSILEQLRKTSTLAPLIDDVRRFAAALGLNFEFLENAPSAVATAQPDPVIARDGPEPDLGTVLVLTLGRRAKEIARHIGAPDWIPVDVVFNPTERAAHSRPGPIAIHVFDGDSPRVLEKADGRYDVVIVLVDDNCIDRQMSSALESLLEVSNRKDTIRICVPALPEGHPSRSLADVKTSSVLGGWRYDAMLDTAQARSPFWWGSARRSLDRRVADIISGAAGLCLSMSVRRWLRSDVPPDTGLLCLAIDLERGRRSQEDPQLLLGSESTWCEPKFSTAPDRSPIVRQTVDVAMRDDSGLRHAFLELRPSGDFDRFALAVMNELFRKEPQNLNRLVHDFSDPPARLLAALQYPRQTLSLRSRVPDADMRLLVTAETPTLEALENANHSGWRVVRYTDRDTILALAHPNFEPGGLRNVPSEVALGPIAASETNRRIATRGADGRDIIRLSAGQLHEWIDRMPPEEIPRLRDEIRPLRASGIHQGGDDSSEFALRRRELVEGRRKDDPVLLALSDILNIDLRVLLVERPYKRAADLETCWSEPGGDVMRFALADGVIPPTLARLRPSEVVLQTFFIIDGDWSVPALFRSRIFETWAAATLSRSNSWMSRFSLGATFASFPIPPAIRVVQAKGFGYMLQCEEKKVLRLAKEVEGHIERITNIGTRTTWKAAQHSAEARNLPAARQLEEILLSTYDLPSDADDLSILTRLVAMNRLLK